MRFIYQARRWLRVRQRIKGWVAERMATAKKKGLPLPVTFHVTWMTPKRDADSSRRVALLGDQGEIAGARKADRNRAVPRQGGIGRCRW